MFTESKTSEIIALLNDLIKNDLTKEVSWLIEDAINELKSRSEIMAKLYEYRISFKDEFGERL